MRVAVVAVTLAALTQLAFITFLWGCPAHHETDTLPPFAETRR